MKALFAIDRAMFARIFAPSDVKKLKEKIDAIPADPGSELPGEMTIDWIASNIDSAEILITGWGTPKLTSELLDSAKNLKAIVHSAGSIKYLIPEDFFSRGIKIANVRHALARGVAETTLAMIIASMKMFMPLSRAVREDSKWRDCEWKDWIIEPYQITVGVVALSEVGKHLLDLLKSFQIDRIVYDPYAAEETIASYGARKVELDELCRNSDVISICAPSTPQTRHMFGREQFAMMKPRARIINTSRGALIDEDALIENLQAGRFNAFLDVTDPEPPADDSPLRTLPNCYLLPHIAGHVNNGCLRQGRLAVDEVLQFAEKSSLTWAVAKDALARMG